MDGDDNHASKRMRLATPISASRGEAQSDDGKTEGDIESQNADAAVERAVLQLQKERRVGITEYVSKDTVGFSGILKQR